MYFQQFCWHKGHVLCPRCGNGNIYLLKSNKYRCSQCKYTFHDFTGRWLNFCSLSHAQWEEIVDFFVVGCSASKISRHLNLSYNLILKALKIIRLSLMVKDEDFIYLLESPLKIKTFCGFSQGNAGFRHCLGEKAPVFSVKYTDTGVEAGYVPHLSVKEVLFMPTRKIFCRSMFVCDYPSEDGYLLFSCCSYLRKKTDCENLPHPRHRLGAESSFWTMCFAMLDSYQKFSPENLPLYLKEFEVRYNYGLSSLKELISRSLCSFVPDLKH